MLAAGLIVLAGMAAFGNSFSGSFVFDDHTSIIDNPSIRRLWPIWPVLSPPANGETVGGRPLLNLSFAVNYALDGLKTRGFHAVNLAIHILNGLFLLGIVRRTLRLPTVSSRLGGASLGPAFVAALLWTVHPLQTESVTYIAQRAESLAGWFFLLVMYCVVRGLESDRPARWYMAAVIGCWLGVAVKETVAVAPLVVLLYDRTFWSGSFCDSLRKRWGLYAGLVVGWILVAGLVFSSPTPVRYEGLTVPDPWSYARSQPGVILYYLRLSLWPDPLCLDYDWPIAQTWMSIVPGMLAIGLLLGATVIGLMGRRGWGFLGAWFFLILSPTSIVVPLQQLAFEHRMYLPLAAVVTMVVIGVYVAGQNLADRIGRGYRVATVVVLVTTAAVMLGVLTFRRNKVYRDEVLIWQDTLAKAPHNARAYYNLGVLNSKAGRWMKAVEYYQQTIRIQPDYAAAHGNLGIALANGDQLRDARDHYERALKINPDSVTIHNNLGTLLGQLGRNQEAKEHFQRAIELKPDYAEAYYNLATACAVSGDLNDAIMHYQQALRIQPEYLLAHNNLAILLAKVGRIDEAIGHHRESLQIKPDFAKAHNDWAMALILAGRIEEAIDHYQQAISIDPGSFSAEFALSQILTQVGRYREAIEHGRRAVGLMPHHLEANRSVAWVIATHAPIGNDDAPYAVQRAEHICALTGRRDLACLDTLAAAYASAGRFDEAVITAKEAWQSAQAAGLITQAQEIHVRLQLYRDRKPYRESAGATR